MKENFMNVVRLGLIAPFCLLAVAACASQPTKHDTPFAQAVVMPDPPKPEKIVAVAQPLPLPGQLQPLPTAAVPEKRRPQTRVEVANRLALQEPSSGGYVNAIQVYPYTTGALYRLYASPQEVSDIALQSGEALTAISAGDTVRWVVGDTTSGTGAAKQVHVLAKPISAGLRTNLVITTDRRSYHLQLESTDRTYMAAVSWTYPDDDLIALRKQNDEAVAAAPIDTGVALGALNFDYVIGGDNPPWKPLRAFDDGKHVYIEFPATLAQGDAPPLFVKGEGGTNDLVNYRVRANYYIVDQLFAVAELRLGTDPQQVVRIRHKPDIRTSDARL
jgi:type IV secretion system protein TrbG